MRGTNSYALVTHVACWIWQSDLILGTTIRAVGYGIRVNIACMVSNSGEVWKAVTVSETMTLFIEIDHDENNVCKKI